MAGRPKIGDGTLTKVRLGNQRAEALEWARVEGVTLNEAIRRLVALGLMTPPRGG